MDEMLTRFDADLAELGVVVTIDAGPRASSGILQATARLSRGASTQEYRLLCGAAVPLAATGHGEVGRPTFVFTTFVAARTADAFRRAGTQYLDTAGNAWIQFGDTFIDVRGRPRPQRTTTHPPISVNMFSAGRSQVVFALLAWPHLWDAAQRDVAHVAGVSVGQANNTLALLAASGYDHHRSHPGQTGLLELWAAAFPAGLAQRLTLATYRGEIGAKLDVDGPVFVSGESAARKLLRPGSLTLYVTELDPRLPVANRWRSDGEANIAVRRKFWHSPETLDARVQDAPWPLVYADLLAGNNTRARAAAKDWRDQHSRLQQHT